MIQSDTAYYSDIKPFSSEKDEKIGQGIFVRHEDFLYLIMHRETYKQASEQRMFGNLFYFSINRKAGFVVHNSFGSSTYYNSGKFSLVSNVFIKEITRYKDVIACLLLFETDEQMLSYQTLYDYKAFSIDELAEKKIWKFDDKIFKTKQIIQVLKSKETEDKRNSWLGSIGKEGYRKSPYRDRE